MQKAAGWKRGSFLCYVWKLEKLPFSSTKHLKDVVRTRLQKQYKKIAGKKDGILYTETTSPGGWCNKNWEVSIIIWNQSEMEDAKSKAKIFLRHLWFVWLSDSPLPTSVPSFGVFQKLACKSWEPFGHPKPRVPGVVDTFLALLGHLQMVYYIPCIYCSISPLAKRIQEWLPGLTLIISACYLVTDRSWNQEYLIFFML